MASEGGLLTVTPAREKKKFITIREIRDELSKVSWTPRGELLFYAKVVVVATFLFGFAIYLVDLSIRALLESIGSLMKWAFLG
mgnify:CR=1 FL=1